jgi:putative PEP-CTERM system TPR-repeat lipoprotein
MRTGIGNLTPNYKVGLLVNVPISLASCFLWTACAIAASPETPRELKRDDVGVTQFLNDADRALQAGNLSLALIQLKSAVRLAPTNGEARAQLGVALLQSGQAVAAERELRQAQSDYGPYDIVVPALLTAMLQRNEFKELLAEFPESTQAAQDRKTPDILAARAIALQSIGQPKAARAAMDHAVALRRDAEGLIGSARLAQQQGDLALARSQTDEALKLSPTNEGALRSRVLLALQAGDARKALENADEFIKRVPGSTTAKLLRIELLLELKNDQKAKQEVDGFLKETPNSLYGRYYRAVLMEHEKDFKGAWQLIQTLPPEFVQSQPPVALMIASIAVVAGYVESGSAILTTLVASHPDNHLARLQLAGLKLVQHAPQAALDVLNPLRTSDDPAIHALLAQAYLGLGRFDQAIPSLEIATSSSNDNTLLKQQLALVQLQVGENDHAIQGLRSLLENDPSNTQLAVSLIAALGRASKLDEALAVVDGLTKQAPASLLPPLYRAQILIARGNFTEAATELSDVLVRDPKFVPALYYRASLSLARGNPEEAQKDLQRIIAENPANVLAYVRLSEIALGNGRDQEGLAILNRAINAAPNDPLPRLALANYQVRASRYQDAQATIDALLRISQGNPEGLALRGQIQILRGQTEEAVKTFRTLAAGNTTSPGAYALLATSLYASKNQLAAENAAKKAIELAPNSVQMQMILIDLQIGAGKGENALAAAQNYANANPGPDAELLLAETLLRLKRTSEAEAVLDKSLGSKPDVRVAMLLSQVAKTSRNFKKSGAVLTNWIAKNPNDINIRLRYAALLIEAGDFAAGRKEYEALFKRQPYDPIVLNNLSWLLQKDDPDRSFSLASLAARIAPQSPEIVDTLGWMKFQHMDAQGALPLLERAHSLDVKSPAISYHLARALDAAGRRAEAKTLLQAAMVDNPKFDGADDAAQLLARW